jgi:trigger factor
VKITTEKLPGSLMSLQIELDKDRFERGLDQAARRLSQKYPIHGFRPGKAPRPMIERVFGRTALIDEASDDLVNKAFRDAIEREQITPVGPPRLERVDSDEPFIFTVTVPVPPTVILGDYRSIRIPLEVSPVTDEQVDRTMDVTRDRHVVLKELEEPRPAQEGDQLRVRLATTVDGEPLEPTTEDGSAPEQTLDLVKGRLVDELFNGLSGANVGDRLEITAVMPDDHASEQVRGKSVVFNVEILGMQERLLPEWADLPALENFEGSLEEMRVKTRTDLETSARNSAERQVIDGFIEQLLAQTSFDVPQVMVRDLAENLLESQGQQFARYGITIDQMLQYRGQSREAAVDELLPEAERQTKITLALQQVVDLEELSITDAEIEAEVERMLLDYAEEQRANIALMLQNQLRGTVANSALDRKLRERMVTIATGELPTAEGNPVEQAPAATE